MELTQEQYNLLKGPMDRYRFSRMQGFKVWTDEDMKKGKRVLAELGIPDPSVGPDACDTCNDGAYSKAVLGQLEPLMTQYEAN